MARQNFLLVFEYLNFFFLLTYQSTILENFIYIGTKMQLFRLRPIHVYSHKIKYFYNKFYVSTLFTVNIDTNPKLKLTLQKNKIKNMYCIVSILE